jgi:hypothetical protein
MGYLHHQELNTNLIPKELMQLMETILYLQFFWSQCISKTQASEGISLITRSNTTTVPSGDVDLN